MWSEGTRQMSHLGSWDFLHLLHQKRMRSLSHQTSLSLRSLTQLRRWTRHRREVCHLSTAINHYYYLRLTLSLFSVWCESNRAGPCTTHCGNAWLHALWSTSCALFSGSERTWQYSIGRYLCYETYAAPWFWELHALHHRYLVLKGTRQDASCLDTPYSDQNHLPSKRQKQQ